MEIAPGINTSEWHALNLDDANSADWDKAINILHKRIKSRYLDPADILLNEDSQRAARERRFGFTILAIDCLLIETLQAFVEGREDTRRKSEQMFRNFLTGRASFKAHFSQSTAKQFYEDFRCGILHQAEIQGKSRVWSVGSLARVENGAMIVNRTEFHSRLKQEFQLYLADLRNPTNRQLRKNFRKKMSHIART